jgi:hypothetical protein
VAGCNGTGFCINSQSITVLIHQYCIICYREEKDLFLNPNEEDILDTNLDELAGAVVTFF